MSMKALCWAIEQEVFSSSQKFVLVALANFANENNHSYPSVATICGITMQKDETVRSGLVALTEQGFIVDTGKRFGPTQQVKVWKLLIKTPEKGEVKDPPEDPPKTPRKGEQSLEPLNQLLDIELPPKKFKSPTLDEVKAYCKTIQLDESEAEKFIDFYQSKGWKVGDQPMKDWQAALRNWKRTNEKKSTNGHPRSVKPSDRSFGFSQQAQGQGARLQALIERKRGAKPHQ